MRTCTTDPISGIDVRNLACAPYVIEGRGQDAVKIYFECQRNKAEYQGLDSEYVEADLALEDL